MNIEMLNGDYGMDLNVEAGTKSTQSANKNSGRPQGSGGGKGRPGGGGAGGQLTKKGN